jgi:hypothetical protein
MIQLILCIVGIVYLVRRPKFANARAESFPGVDPTKFAEWRRLELKSTDVFLWATWGTFVLSFVLAFGVVALTAVLGGGQGGSGPVVGVLVAIMSLLFFGGLIISAIAGSQAAKLRKELGINL